MVNVVAYPDIALEKFIGLNPSGDAQYFFQFNTKPCSSLGTRTADPNTQAVNDSQHRTPSGSVSRGPAIQWFESLAAGLNWKEVRGQIINKFTDAEDKYRKLIHAKNIKRQLHKLLENFIHRLTKSIEKGW